jgi:hypothetical protein
MATLSFCYGCNFYGKYSRVVLGRKIEDAVIEGGNWSTQEKGGDHRNLRERAKFSRLTFRRRRM